MGGCVAAVAGAFAVVFGGGAMASTTVHVKSTLIGAAVSATENVYDVRGPTRGAAIQFVKENKKATGGTFTGTSYFGNGTQASVGTYTNSLPNTKGIITLKATGRFVRGTGIYKNVRGRFTGLGTLNTKTNGIRIQIKGTETG
jgi:hypothetical protein